jgi:phage shock protein C
MTRRKHRHHYDDYRDHYHRGQQQFKTRRSNGWGMNLYRNTRDGKIGGVAAGLADHWDIAHWVVRLMWVGAFLFTGTLALWAYVAAWIVLAPRPRHRGDHRGSASPEPDFGGGFDDDFDDVEVEMEYDERHHEYRPRKVFRYSEPSHVRLERARERLDSALARVENMEAYVTSRQYKLNKEFSRL